VYSSQAAGPEAYPLNEDGTIEPYVNFGELFTAIEEAKKRGLIATDFAV